MSVYFVLEMLGTLAFAISGIRLASAKRFDWFGAYVVGFTTAIGGGTLRDLMLSQTPFWMLDSVYLIVTAIALGIVILFGRYLIRLNNTFFIFDAVGLGLFTVVGIEKTLAADFPFWVAVIMGTMTGAAGGVLRDILINEEPLIFRKEIYALAGSRSELVASFFTDDMIPVSRDGVIKVLPRSAVSSLPFIEDRLHVVSSGCSAGEMKRGTLVPDADMALSLAFRKESFSTAELDTDTALSYLQGNQIVLRDMPAGYTVVCHRSLPLGFVKNLGARCNNLYPRSRRIRMEIKK